MANKLHTFEEDAWEELETFYAENPDYVEEKVGEPIRSIYVEEPNQTEEESEYPERLILEMENDDGTVVNYEFVARLTENEKNYAVLYPLQNNENNEVVCLRLEEAENGNALFGNIEDDEERFRIQNQFVELMSSEDSDEA